MKLYFTLTDGVENSPINLDMLRLALKSAKENTSLKLYALYDGTPNDKAYKIFEEYGTDIILCQCSFRDKLEKYYQNKSNDIRNGIKRMLGCFMKFDIAIHEQEDDVVLYADIDTIFLQDVDWNAFKTKTIVAAPEFDKNYDIIKGYKYFSASPMFINIGEAKKRRLILLDMLDKNIQPYQECWDQGFWNELYKDDFEKLPIEFNWKPYWGINGNAKIIHIHGYKLGSMTKDDAQFCGGVMGRFPDAYDGWLYYTIKSYKILGSDKDKFIVDLAKFLNSARVTTNKKQWYFSSYILHLLYVKLEKYKQKKVLKLIYEYAKRKLIKRNIIRKD